MRRFSLKRRIGEDDLENDLERFFPSANEGVDEVFNQQAKRKYKQPSKDGLHFKKNWLAGCNTWSYEGLKESSRLKRDTFDFALEVITHLLYKEPTSMEPNPIENYRQLGLALYRMMHGCSFKVIMGMFWVSQSLTTETFNNVIKYTVFTSFDGFVWLPRTKADWAKECKSFNENYEFLCVGAWDGFQVRLDCRLKSYFSFKNKYTITSMGLIAHNKRFLHL